METPNRRQDYRFRFAYLARPKVELIHAGGPGGATVQLGALLNLSISGAGILLPQEVPQSQWKQDWFIRFSLTDKKKNHTSLALLCRIVHHTSTKQGHLHGLQFLAMNTASHEVERRVLWQFLLDEQRHSLGESSA